MFVRQAEIRKHLVSPSMSPGRCNQRLVPKSQRYRYVLMKMGVFYSYTTIEPHSVDAALRSEKQRRQAFVRSRRGCEGVCAAWAEGVSDWNVPGPPGSGLAIWQTNGHSEARISISLTKTASKIPDSIVDRDRVCRCGKTRGMGRKGEPYD